MYPSILSIFNRILYNLARYKWVKSLFLSCNFYFAYSLDRCGGFSARSVCRKLFQESPWKINGGNITNAGRKRRVWWIKWTREATRAWKPMWSFGLREKERERKGLLTSLQFLREIMRGIRGETNEEESLWLEYKRNERTRWRLTS